MLQEHKELLLKDLCVRLPYDVKVQFKVNRDIENKDNYIYNVDGEYEYITIGKSYLTLDIIKMLSDNCIDEIKPYLFPRSSMTEEQRNEYVNLCAIGIDECGDIVYFDTYESIDYLYKIHVDVKNFIPKGLAIDATNLNIY